ncbi:P-loop containing nucleoside triphosphate hydrolase protein, partial [Trichophaea hybrida]
VLGPSKSNFLSMLRGSFIASPPGSRPYPLLSTRGKWSQNAIQLVSFGSSTQGMLRGGIVGDGYVSARYETLREQFDLTLMEWLEASIDSRLNPYEDATSERVEEEAREIQENRKFLKRVMKELQLDDLREQAVKTLSNVQSRRAKVAQALLKKPELLIVDEPFLGLDPTGHSLLSTLLDHISNPENQTGVMPVILGLRSQDTVPVWSTHLAYVEDDKIVFIGEKANVVSEIQKQGKRVSLEGEETTRDRGVVEKTWAGIGNLQGPLPRKDLAEPLVEMENIKIAYYDKVILNDFSWTIRRGEKWGLFGPNGSGKTTLTSIITSDHPLTYSLPVLHFSRPRLLEPGKRGISVFDVQSRIGISSPEIHSFFPRHLSLCRCVESGFAPTLITKPIISPLERSHIDAVLSEFQDLVPDGWECEFGDADMSTQRLALFLRATVLRQDLVVYDEAFSGMRREVREWCFGFLEMESGWKEGRQAMVCVCHVSEEVPRGVKWWVRLGEKGGKDGAVFGEFQT